MGAKFGSDDDVIADINITPFVDIILVVHECHCHHLTDEGRPASSVGWLLCCHPIGRLSGFERAVF